MRLLSYRPETPLSEYVELLWLGEGARLGRELERVLPTGERQLLIGPPEGRFVAYDRITGEPRRHDGELFCGAAPEPVIILEDVEPAEMERRFQELVRQQGAPTGPDPGEPA